jgi:hypothetical protein
MKDGKIYLVTNYYIYGDIAKDDPGGYVPALYADGKEQLVDYRCISILPNRRPRATPLFRCMISKRTIGENQTVLGGGSTVYMNEDNLYIARTVYEEGAGEPYKESVYTVVAYDSYWRTEVSRFDIASGGIKLVSTGSVKGTPINQFALDEKDGFLRIVTTTNTESYKVYTDEKYGWSNYVWDESKSTARCMSWTAA